MLKGASLMPLEIQELGECHFDSTLLDGCGIGMNEISGIVEVWPLREILANKNTATWRSQFLNA